ncbi:MAG TPA: hypothetical protein VKH81_05085 [Candidatus Angelobacter sp.]|nr:hypothetical protein [Candidatus Angelobacter sp.]
MVVGIAAFSRRVYSNKVAGIGFLLVSMIAPAALIWLAAGTLQKWIALICLATTLVNIAVIGGAMQQGWVPVLRLPQKMRKRAKGHVSPVMSQQGAQPSVDDRTADPGLAARIPAIAGSEPPFSSRDAS